jgi:hypothetical protein
MFTVGRQPPPMPGPREVAVAQVPSPLVDLGERGAERDDLRRAVGHAKVAEVELR